MKHLHMLVAVIIALLFVYQSMMAWQGRMANKSVKIMTHIGYAMMLITGILLVMPLLSLNVPLQWVGAKVVLLIAFVSASSKAYKLAQSSADNVHIKKMMGLFVALIALVGIFSLAFIKPSNFF